MKVESSRAARAAGAKRTAKQGKGPSGAFAQELKDLGEAADAGGAAAAAPVSAVDALLSVQEAGDATQGRNGRARDWGLDILDRLDEIRMGLLTGSIPLHQLEGLTALIARQRERGVDRRLSDILDDIELRARVELAKLGRSRKGR